MGMPNWTPGPWRIGLERHPIGYAVVAINETPANSEGEIDYYGGFLVAESLTPENANLIVKAPAMADALAQWAAAESTGDDDELRNARAERDRILAELVGDKK